MRLERSLRALIVVTIACAPVFGAPRPARGAGGAPLLSLDEVRAITVAGHTVAGHMVRDAARLRARLGPYADWIARHERVDLGAVWIASFDAVECLIQRAIDRGLTAPALFSDPLFARGGALSLFVDRDVLAAVEGAFDLHSVFLIDARTHGDDQPLPMSYFLIGQGALVLRYPRAASFDHPDPAYRVSVPLFGSSRTYDAAPLIFMDIVRDPLGGPGGFDHVATLDAPAGRPEDFVGPWNAAIRGISVRGTKLDVHAHLLFDRTQTLEVPRIQRRAGHPAVAARLRALGCPSGAVWGAPAGAP